MAVSATWQAVCSIVETLDSSTTPGAPTATRKITHTEFNGGGLIDANTTVPATKCAVFKKTLASGLGTLDLTSLSGTIGSTVTFDGLKLQLMLIHNPVGNNVVRITSGASNGYTFGGVSTFSCTLKAGQYALFYTPDGQPDVSSTVKTFDLNGSGTEQVYFSMVAG